MSTMTEERLREIEANAEVDGSLAAVRELIAEVHRLDALTAPKRTHFPGCWDRHLECAHREIQRLRTVHGNPLAPIALALRDEVERLRGLLVVYEREEQGRCHWCGNKGDHTAACVAFLPDGTVR